VNDAVNFMRWVIEVGWDDWEVVAVGRGRLRIAALWWWC
jgi:hypothetical protein